MSRNYKPILKWFRERMDRKLGLPQNLRKPAWRKDTNDVLLGRLHEETTELEDALADEFHGGKAEIELIIDEAADVANFAMMIADNARRLETK